MAELLTESAEISLPSAPPAEVMGEIEGTVLREQSSSKQGVSLAWIFNLKQLMQNSNSVALHDSTDCISLSVCLVTLAVRIADLAPTRA